MTKKRYHYTKGFPAGLKYPDGRYALRYTNHAFQKFGERIGQNQLVETLDTDTASLLEITTEVSADGSETFYALVYRKPFTATHDIIFVVSLCQDYMVVVTVWQNAVADNHATLKVVYDAPVKITPAMSLLVAINKPTAFQPADLF